MASLLLIDVQVNLHSPPCHPTPTPALSQVSGLLSAESNATGMPTLRLAEGMSGGSVRRCSSLSTSLSTSLSLSLCRFPYLYSGGPAALRAAPALSAVLSGVVLTVHRKSASGGRQHCTKQVDSCGKQMWLFIIIDKLTKVRLFLKIKLFIFKILEFKIVMADLLTFEISLRSLPLRTFVGWSAI
jgi:hypothetical protein